MRRRVFALILVLMLSGVVSADVDLSEAMDTTLIFTTGGDSDWFGQTADSFNGGDSARSGNVSNEQESWMQTTVPEAGTLSFYWKVSSEEYCDFLEFYIDAELSSRISGMVDWQYKVFILEKGSHTLDWRFFRDFSFGKGSDAGWVDKVIWIAGEVPPPPPDEPDLPPPPISLADAMDTSFAVTTGGDAEWFGQTEVSIFGGDAAQSGDILDNQVSWMQATIEGTGTVSFSWKVSSEEYSDFLEFYIDGEMKSQISGVPGWQEKILNVNSEGTHTLEWRYTTDESFSFHQNRGWVDNLVFADGEPQIPDKPDPPTPPAPIELSDALDTALEVSTGGDVDWFGQTEVFSFGGDAAQSGNISDGQMSWIQVMVEDTGTLNFLWKVSSEEYADLLQFYIDGELQSQISGVLDWHKKVFPITEGKHILEWRYMKDGNFSFHADRGWVDMLVLDTGMVPPPPPDPVPPEPKPAPDLSEALDTYLSFTVGGDAGWAGQTNTSYSGGDAAKSGDIMDGQVSTMQTVVEKATTISFFWKVSSEEYCDYLEFYIDGELQSRISGMQDWLPKTYTVGSGSHVLEWCYIKDGMFFGGSDSAWVDALVVE